MKGQFNQIYWSHRINWNSLDLSIFIDCIDWLSSFLLVGHKSDAIVFHLVLFFGPLSWQQDTSFSFQSAIQLQLHDCLGLPLLCFACGFHSKASLAMLPSGLLSLCPIHCLLLLFNSNSNGSWPVSCQSSSFSSHLIPNTWSLFSKSLAFDCISC